MYNIVRRKSDKPLTGGVCQLRDMAQEQLDRMHQLVLVKNLLMGVSGSKTAVMHQLSKHCHNHGHVLGDDRGR